MRELWDVWLFVLSSLGSLNDWLALLMRIFGGR